MGSSTWSWRDRRRELNSPLPETLVPAREAAGEILGLERKLSDLVNAAYGLTPEELALMWRTAPPRMPLDPVAELRRMEGGSVSARSTDMTSTCGEVVAGRLP